MPYTSLIKTCMYSFVACLLLSCIGLKTSQLTAVEKYTIVTKGISVVPPDVYNRVYQLRSQTQTLQLSGVVATNESAKESIDALQADLSDKLKFLDMVDSFAYAYRIVGKYADLVHCLISESYLKDFTKNKKQWQSSFDGLVTTYNAACAKRIPQSTRIPPSVGSIAANIINELGSAKIKSLQKKYLKNAVSTARKPFEGICDDFLNTDIPKIQKELEALPQFVNENYKDFLNNVKAYETKQGNNPYNYYKWYLPIYLNWQVQLRELSTLVNQLHICILSLRNSYGVLDNYISADKPGKEVPAEIIQLEADYLALLDTVAKFSEARERLFKITY
ncbi:hypothetical protein [Ferruginibacter sp. SUN106]|uniref:hypothetical protein n=1 Tax=Ferruginibacter sp. SUN106 TaxID=2978348 RepID=UPI003D36C00E